MSLRLLYITYIETNQHHSRLFRCVQPICTYSSSDKRIASQINGHQARIKNRSLPDVRFSAGIIILPHDRRLPTSARLIRFLFAFILHPRSLAAAQMALGFIALEHASCACIQLRVEGAQADGYILMHRRLAHSKPLRRTAHGRILLDYILRQTHGALADIFVQGQPSQ